MALKDMTINTYKQLEGQPTDQLLDKYWHYHQRHNHLVQNKQHGSVKINSEVVTFREITWMYVKVLVKLFRERGIWDEHARKPKEIFDADTA